MIARMIPSDPLADSQKHRFLSRWPSPPARLTAEELAWVLNITPKGVQILVSHGLLKPLGSPESNSVKFFATVEVIKLIVDERWLSRITDTLYDHWKHKNGPPELETDGREGGVRTPRRTGR